MALAWAAAVLLLAGSASACLLPPRGCRKEVCDRYFDLNIPGAGDYSVSSTWRGNFNKLAFIRSAFNKNLGSLGPSPFTSADGASRWLRLYSTYPGYGLSNLPTLNYEWYEVNGATVKTDATPVPGYPNPDANVGTCCHACRLTPGCPLYLYLPSSYAANSKVANGKCYFVKTGGTLNDGPFQWSNVKDRNSPRTVNIGAPASLTKSQGVQRWNAGQLGVNSRFPYPTFALVFLGGFCNPNNHSDGSVTDDPHFTGAHGTRFDFNGELNKAFCLVTDKTVHLNAVLKGYESDNTFGASEGKSGKATRSWIKELGLVWTDAQGQQHSLHLVARDSKEAARGDGFISTAAYDGQAFQVPQDAGSSFEAGDLKLTFLGTAKKSWFEMDRFSLRVGEQVDLSFNLRVAHPKLQTPQDAEAHFNIMVNDLKVTESVHGVLGQTYRNTPSQMMKAVKYSELNKLMGGPVTADGESGAGFLEGSVADYEASHVLGTDCKVSAFAGSA